MIYYSITDLIRAFNISSATLKAQIKSGKLEAHKLYNYGNTYMYIVPETELYKLEDKKKREPMPSPFVQPGYSRRKLGVQNYIDDDRQYHYVDYHEYIHSEQWQKVRLERFRLDGFKCQLCGSGKNLEGHHVSYKHLGQPEEINDVVSLCKECHKKVHTEDEVKKTASLSLFDWRF